MSAIRVVPKAELHVHIEGTMRPALVRAIAERNGLRLDAGLFTAKDRFAWTNFSEFLRAFDAASTCLRRPTDLRDIAYLYLGEAAAEGAIYVEFFASPDHASACGLNYASLIEGLSAAIDDAERDFDICARIIMICVRHLGPETAENVVRAMATWPHPYVVGFGMAGDETQYRARDFARAFGQAADLGLGCTAHAGEVAGADSVRATLDSLPVSRIGHGVRAIEDPALVDAIARRGLILEVCPGSNLALGLYPDAASHPLSRLIEAGCRVALGSDDPPFFDTSIGREYRRAQEDFGFDDAMLGRLTRTAIEGSFADTVTRRKLLGRFAGIPEHGL